jgi:hypothetical protein
MWTKVIDNVKTERNIEFIHIVLADNNINSKHILIGILVIQYYNKIDILIFLNRNNT